MDTLICEVCRGAGDVVFQSDDKSVSEFRVCDSCHGSGQSPLYRTRILKRSAHGGKSVAMEVAVATMDRFLKKEEK